MVVKVVTKTKAATKSVSLISEKVERLAELRILLREYEKLVKEQDTIKEGLKKLIPDGWNPASPFVFEGTEHDAEFSAQSEVRSVTDLMTVHKLLGDDVFYAIAKVSLKDLDKYLSEEEQGEFVAKERTGPRKLSLKEK
jgi:hypothetical protein